MVVGQRKLGLDYDLVAGLNLVNNANANANTPTAPGVTGLFGLTGEVVGNQVELFATSYGLNELSPSFLYEITDNLSFMTIAQASGESFTTLFSAPSGVDIRGVALPRRPDAASRGPAFVRHRPRCIGAARLAQEAERRSAVAAA